MGQLGNLTGNKMGSTRNPEITFNPMPTEEELT